MSYYILPKNINLPEITVDYSKEPQLDVPANIYISNSLANYYCQIKQQIDELFVDNIDMSDNSFDAATRVINPYEFIFSKVPGSKYSVSKLKPHSNLFYDLLEISTNINVFESFDQSYPIRCLHVSSNFEDSVECVDMIREDAHDTHIIQQSLLKQYIKTYIRNYDFVFFEPEYTTDYFESLQICLGLLLNAQKYNGIAIIKIHNIFYKPVVDFLYILSSLYDKVYVTKPSSSNIVTFEKYVVCKHFRYNEQLCDINVMYKLNALSTHLLADNNAKHIQSFCENYEVPCYFKNKIDDLNMIMGQQQLDALDQIISIYKNKNKQDKIESIKKNNIQKSVSWCEKYKIPCNKFTEKINIFLPIINDPTLPLQSIV